MKNIYYYDTQLGKIGIAECNECITDLFFAEDDLDLKDVEVKETVLLKEASNQLLSFLSGKQKVFDLPLAPEGTEFMKSVWQSLCKIPFGQTVSYKYIAQSIGNEKACRAVGNANNKNPIAIIIPCHRVIGTNGKLVGYAGGLDIKKYLLDLEKGVEYNKQDNYCNK